MKFLIAMMIVRLIISLFSKEKIAEIQTEDNVEAVRDPAAFPLR